MKREYILTVIGSGSTYTPELIDGVIARRDSLHFKEIRLMDVDEQKRKIVGELCERMIRAAGLNCRVMLTENLDQALEGADFVVTQIRVGRLPARVLDETIPLKYDLIGQETTGIGGFFKALRTIPVMLHIALRMEVLCPNAFLINFTNPSGIITQAVRDHSSIRMIGLCNMAVNMAASLAENLGLEQEKMQLQYVGLNHLSWITGIYCEGKEYLAEAIEKGINAEPMKNIQASGFSAECLRVAGGIPSSYLEYFYNREEKLAQQKEAEKCRGEICMALEEELLEIYSNSNLHRKPAQLEQRGGAKYSLAAMNLIDSIVNDKGEIHVVGVKNGDTLPFLHPEDVIEVACRIDSEGATPLPVEHFNNTHIEEMMQMVKAYERHTVRAAVEGSDDEALRALVIHPLIGDYRTARECYEEMKKAHAEYLPQFFDK